MHIDFQKCREKIAGSLNEYCNRWCKRENVEGDAVKDWKSNIFKIIDRRISFYSHNTNMLPRKPKISYRYLKSGIEEFPYHFKKIVVRYKRIGYNINVMRQTACLVVNPIKVNSFAYLFNCTTVGRTSD